MQYTDSCKTVRIVAPKAPGNPDGFTEINESDFNPKEHKLFKGDVKLAATPTKVVELRTDGPTLEEYIAAGYAAESYPPEGYAAKPSLPKSEIENPGAPTVENPGAPAGGWN